ncbi:transporter substrate-binding domain-containing protein [Desulforhopalus vacuolatus]|uniref:transporter substrate-binding domain-containing protein n=1 Tax=Desulforhopalus vacuolatus TaxID=40414 RepID=UPI0019635393|nr:transporter substrate-binding domain-containing protein [Desulforhopalus vacuolatus]MBM9520966.1 transporter substrate-binding domain-containing protein [Desulforhopalus vacuolatus]
MAKTNSKIVYIPILKLILCMVLFQYTLFDASATFGKTGNNLAQLTDNEISWLDAHPIIRLAPDPEFQPIEFFDKEGNYDGIGADYVRLISEKLGIKFEVVKCTNWDDVLARMKRHEVDVLNAVVKTPQREKYLHFPPPYLEIPSAIIVRKNVTKELTLDSLKGLHVVMISGYGYVDLVRNKYPEIQIELVSDLKSALQKVSFGMADAFVGDLATASFYIELEGITNLKMAGESEPPNISGFAVRSDWPELGRILEKGVALLTEEERKDIFKKWIHLAAEPGVTRRELKKLMVFIFSFITLVIVGFLLWNRQLKRMVNLKTEDLSKEIKEHNRAQEALKESETHLRTLLKIIPDLVWLKDSNGIYLACNSKFERFFGAKEKDIVGKTDYDFVPKELADFFRKNDLAAIDKKVPSLNEEEIAYADDGHREILETIKTPMYGKDGQLIGVLGIARDITERKQAEEDRKQMEEKLRQSHKMEAIGTLAGGIAHDFNNILAAILGYAEMVSDEVPEFSPAQKDIQEVLKAGKRAKELVKHILTFSRKSGQEHVPVDIHLIAKEALNLLRASIPTTIEIHQEIDPKCGTVHSNPTQIHQILMNLCTNAAQAMDEKGGILKVSLDCTDLPEEVLQKDPTMKPGQYVKLTVSDNGPGIDKDIIDRIFDPYYTTKEIGKGSGMGLTVVHGIVKSHDGIIMVESKLGNGATFTVFLPNAEEEFQQETEIVFSLPTGNERVLVVDDEETVAEMTKRRLESLGYQVTLETDSIKALELFRSNPHAFDLIISDQTMPILTGEQLARELLNIKPDIPIIICTGYSSKIDVEKANSIGISAFLMKPVDNVELSKTVRQTLDAL